MSTPNGKKDMPSSTEIIKRLKAAGWVLKNAKGDHHHFEHPDKPGKVTVKHPAKDLSVDLVKKMERQAGITLR
ncbi:type II toxin-antitoxin system HicA family toxin [Desulfolutivibrio sulfodismutans]